MMPYLSSTPHRLLFGCNVETSGFVTGVNFVQLAHQCRPGDLPTHALKHCIYNSLGITLNIRVDLNQGATRLCRNLNLAGGFEEIM